MNAAKAGNKEAATDAEKRWFANADEIEKQALSMADMMTKGIVRQFPCKFIGKIFRHVNHLINVSCFLMRTFYISLHLMLFLCSYKGCKVHLIS